ncbi:MAG: LacI family transcriptional regulator [Pseudothermotoga sp.]|nr:LacI family transcriptional regulator [Pseudothermotoga sp.]
MSLRKRYVTIVDIAKRAGVSINTVSRALNNKPDISEDTKKRILSIARELGYIKNITASLLRQKQTQTVGVILADSSNPFYAEVLKGIEAASRKYGYQIILMNTERVYQNEVNAIELLFQRRVDGLLIAPVQEKDEDIKKLSRKDIPAVILGRHFEDIEIDEIYNDDLKGGYIAANHLLENGRNKTLIICGPLYNSAARMRVEGFRKALCDHGIEFDRRRVFITDINIEDGYTAIKNALEERIKFDSVFCYNDLVAFGAIKALKEMNFSLPEEVAVVGYDDIIFSSFICPSLTTVKIKKYEMGFEAFRMLLERMRGKRKRARKILLDVELIVRESA